MPSSSQGTCRASLLGLGLAAPGFHSDGCLETKRHISQSHHGVFADGVPFDQSGQEMWPAVGCLQLEKAREEGTTVSAFWSLGDSWGGLGYCSEVLKLEREPGGRPPGLFSGVHLLL